MKKLLSVILSISVLVMSIGGLSLTASAQDNSPHIQIEISDYLNKNTFSSRSGSGKTSATKGEKIAVTFILSGVDSIECYQLSGIYDTQKLSAGYYEDDAWVTGDELQDYDTIVAGSADYTCSELDDSFSFTRTIEEPYICLVGYSLAGGTQVEQGTKLISVGFKVLEDIGNIYDAFTWDENTMVAVALEEEEYYIGNGLYFGIDCHHSYTVVTVAPTCTQEGYTQYTCTLCGNTYTNDYVTAAGHSLTVTKNMNTYSYSCSQCDYTTAKTADELRALWSVEYINKPPTVENDSQYLDLAPDNIINAKDYAILNQTDDTPDLDIGGGF